MFGKRGKYEAVPTEAAVKYQKKSAKSNLLSAYFTSLLCLILCATMFLSTSMAWFTSEVNNSGNQIYVGMLDVKLLHEDEGKWYDIETNSGHRILDWNLRWEPNGTYIERLQVQNDGDLAFNYRLGMSINYPETEGFDKAKAEEAAKYISVYVIRIPDKATYVEPKDLAEIEENWTKVGTLSEIFAGKLVLSGAMGEADVVNVNNGVITEVGTTHEYAIAFHMDAKAPSSIMGAQLKDINVKLIAAQTAAEKDVFGPNYDLVDMWDGTVDTAWYNDTDTEFVINTAEQLAGLSKLVYEGNNFAGKTVKLGFNIDLANKAWTPIGRMINTSGTGENSTFKGNFDGQGYTIYNLNVDTVDSVVGNDSNKGAGLFGAITGNIKSVNVVNATINTAHWAGVIAGSIEGSISNCAVENVNINCLTEQVDGNWDNGDKAGAIVGYATSGVISNCAANDVTITAYRDMGAIAGASYNSLINCSVSNVKLIKDDTNDYKGTEDDNTVNEYVGRILGEATVEVNSSAGDVMLGKLVANQSELEAAVNAGALTVGLTSGEYELKGNQKDGLTIIGLGDGVKISNLTNYAGNGNYGAIWQHVNFENVIFTEKIYTMDGGAKSTFKNCTFEQGFRGGYSRGVIFDNCTFYDNSEGFAMHFEKVYTTVEVTDCRFVEGTIAFGDNGDGMVTFNNCTFSGETTRTEYFDAWASCVLNDCTFAEGTEIWLEHWENGETVTLNNTTGATVVPK